MAYIISLFLGGIVYLMIFIPMDAKVGNNPGVAVALPVSIIAAIFIFKKLTKGNSMSDTIVESISATKEISSRVEEKDADFYVIAEEEINKGQINKSLWSQALVKANGKEELRKVEYMKLRAKQLRKEK